jgi:hypothetical protein
MGKSGLTQPIPDVFAKGIKQVTHHFPRSSRPVDLDRLTTTQIPRREQKISEPSNMVKVEMSDEDIINPGNRHACLNDPRRHSSPSVDDDIFSADSD